MIVTSKISMDLLENGYVPAIEAVQNDRYCRNLELTLYAGGEAWAVPEDAEVVVHYSKSDGTGGEYDTLPDGSCAWSAAENVLTVALAPQVLTAVGPVNLAVSLSVGDARVTTFSLLVNVQAEVGSEVDASGDYYCVPRFLPAPEGAEVGQYFRAAEVDAQGRITRLEAVDVVEEVVGALDGSDVPVNLLEGAVWEAGYLTGTGELSAVTACQSGEVSMTEPVAIQPGGVYTIRNVTTNTTYAWLAYAEYDAEGNFLRRFAFDAYSGQFPEYTVEDGQSVYAIGFTASEDAYGLRLCGRTFLFNAVNGSATEEQIAEAEASAGEIFQLYEQGSPMRLLPEVTEAEDGKVMLVQDGVWMAGLPGEIYRNENIKSVNHRGYNSVAPENTLAAFRLSKRMGFTWVEADVSFTADGYAVLLHDETVDRTSDGTGSIGELTFEYVRSLDFGSWKSEEYAGEQIPTFEEFLALCRRLGLKPYVEIKAPVNQEQVEGLVLTARRYGMLDSVTWITGAGTEILEWVKASHSSARLGLVCETLTEESIAAAAALRKEDNEVFLDIVSTQLTEELREKCMEQEIPVEVWDLWSEEQILAADGYISGFTTDAVIAGKVLCGAEIG